MTKKNKYFHGINLQIIAITGYSTAYVSQVLNGKVATNGKKAKRILELAERLNNLMEMAVQINK